MHFENKILFSWVVPTTYNSLARTILFSPTIQMHYWWPKRCLVKWFFKCICTDFLFLFSKSRLLVGELPTLTLPINMPEGDFGDKGTLRISIGVTFLGYEVFASSSNFYMWDTIHSRRAWLARMLQTSATEGMLRPYPNTPEDLSCLDDHDPVVGCRRVGWQDQNEHCWFESSNWQNG